MAETNEGGGGGYGGTSPGGGICWISPSDLAGQVFNLMSRISQLESDLNLLKSSNVSAITLSDLSSSAGGFLISALSQSIVAQFGRVNAWAWSAGENWIGHSSTAGTSVVEYPYPSDSTIGATLQMNSNSSVNGVAGKQNDFSGRMNRDVPFLGGWMFEGRFLFHSLVFSPSVISSNANDMRVLIGLSNENTLQANATWNSDSPGTTGVELIAFQFSGVRGDTTWKIIVKGTNSLFTPSSATIIDTGVTAEVGEWYDMSMRREVGSNMVSWSIVGVVSGVAGSGSFTTPDWPVETAVISHGFMEFFTIWNNLLNKSETLEMHHFWAQNLDTNDPMNYVPA